MIAPKQAYFWTKRWQQGEQESSRAIQKKQYKKKYRLTWEYGPDQGMITLRNIDNHDECLKKA